VTREAAHDAPVRGGRKRRTATTDRRPGDRLCLATRPSIPVVTRRPRCPSCVPNQPGPASPLRSRGQRLRGRGRGRRRRQVTPLDAAHPRVHVTNGGTRRPGAAVPTCGVAGPGLRGRGVDHVPAQCRGSCSCLRPVAIRHRRTGAIRHPFTVNPVVGAKSVACVSDPALPSTRSPTRRIDRDRFHCCCGYHCLLVSASQPPRATGRHTADLVARASGAAGGDPAGPPYSDPATPGSPPWLRSSPQGVTGRSAWAASRLSGRLPSVRYPRPLTRGPAARHDRADGWRRWRTGRPADAGQAANQPRPAAGGTAVVRVQLGRLRTGSLWPTRVVIAVHAGGRPTAERTSNCHRSGLP